VLVPFAAVNRIVGFPESPPLLEVEDLEVLPSPQPTSPVKVAKSTRQKLRIFFNPNILFPISAVYDKNLHFLLLTIPKQMS